MMYGLFLQSVAVKYGRGRVLAFTDSTCFSNYCVFMDEYPVFLLGSMNYLNRTNVYNYLNKIFLAQAITCLALLIFLYRKEKKIMVILLVLSIGTLSYGAAVSTFSQINKVNYKRLTSPP